MLYSIRWKNNAPGQPIALLATKTSNQVALYYRLLLAIIAPFLICSLLTFGFYASAIYEGKRNAEISPRTMNKHQIRMVMEMMRQGETIDDALHATMGDRSAGL